MYCSLSVTLFAVVTIGIEDPEIEVDEDAGTAEVCVRVLAGELSRNVIVTLSTSDGTAFGESPPWT